VQQVATPVAAVVTANVVAARRVASEVVARRVMAGMPAGMPVVSSMSVGAEGMDSADEDDHCNCEARFAPTNQCARARGYLRRFLRSLTACNGYKDRKPEPSRQVS
jgi:hypothetical protein